MADTQKRLRVAFLAGTLTQGGAEKQFVYMVRALSEADIAVRVYCLTRGEFYENELRRLGLSPVWVGRIANPALRIAALARALAGFRPHIVQSGHFYANLYVSAVAPLYRAIAVGAIRSDTYYNMSMNGRWGPWLLRAPRALLTNSHAAKRNAEALGIDAEAVQVVPNVIHLLEFERMAAERDAQMRANDRVVAATVGDHVSVKRLDRFLGAVSLAREHVSAFRGMLIGDGPEQERLRAIAEELGLLPDGVHFLGRRNNIAALLKEADMLLLTSDHEGFSNAILEAMAARLPVITTPAGDAEVVVRDGVTGYVVPFDDVGQMADRMVRLARSPRLRRDLGNAGRQQVERLYNFEGLADSLLTSYRAAADMRGCYRVSKLIR